MYLYTFLVPTLNEFMFRVTILNLTNHVKSKLSKSVDLFIFQVLHVRTSTLLEMMRWMLEEYILNIIKPLLKC